MKTFVVLLVGLAGTNVYAEDKNIQNVQLEKLACQIADGVPSSQQKWSVSSYSVSFTTTFNHPSGAEMIVMSSHDANKDFTTFDIRKSAIATGVIYESFGKCSTKLYNALVMKAEKEDQDARDKELAKQNQALNDFLNMFGVK